MSDQNPDETRMSFGEHLEELRRRIILSLTGTFAVFLVALFFQDQLVDLIMIPWYQAIEGLGGDKRAALITIKPQETFIFYMKICFFTGLFVGAPITLYQMWRFVAAGLYPHERKAVMRIFPFSVILLMVGMIFGFTVLLPLGLGFLLGYGSMDIEVTPTIGSYFTFLMAVTLVMGFLFQLPLVMSVCSRMGLIKVVTFRTYRRHFIVAAFVAAAFLTPPDPVTQVLMGIPVIGLYELGVRLAVSAEKRAAAQNDASPSKNEEKSA